METLDKKYGLWTSIAMVVGVVIGSGIFFKTDDVLRLTNGSLSLALFAWIIGAFSMIFGALVFSKFAERIQKANGIVDYTEVAYGKRMGYIVGWFNGVLYYSPLSAILAYISAEYTLMLIQANSETLLWGLALFYLILSYMINYFSPTIAGRLQVTTTVIKLIPLFLIAIIGIIYGLSKGIMIDNFTLPSLTHTSTKGSLASAVVTTAFAFEGWIVATTINNEIKDSKKNLPRALTIGSLIIFIVYVTYFLGVAGVVNVDTILKEGNNTVALVNRRLFGPGVSSLLTVFVIISCLGTLNGLVISCIRTPYSLAIRNQGPLPHLLAKVHAKTQMPTYSVIYAFSISLFYLIIWYASLHNWFGTFIAIDEIPIVLIYAFYILLYLWYMKNYKELNLWNRFILPVLAIIGSLFILYGGITKPSIGVYLVVSLAMVFLGLFFYRNENSVD